MEAMPKTPMEGVEDGVEINSRLQQLVRLQTGKSDAHNMQKPAWAGFCIASAPGYLRRLSDAPQNVSTISPDSKIRPHSPSVGMAAADTGAAAMVKVMDTLPTPPAPPELLP